MSKTHEKAHEETMEAKVKAPVEVDITGELEAIRVRLAERRRTIAAPVPYTSTDLADAEWLMVELDKAMGISALLTPSEQAELLALTARRKLSLPEQAVMDRITAKHGDLTPAELVELDYLTMTQDAQLGPDLDRYNELVAKSKKDHPKKGSKS